MSQYAYILVVISLLFLFLVNKYEKEKLQRLLQDQLLKDPVFRATITEKIQSTENINDVIDYINKGYRLGIPLQKKSLTKFATNKKTRDDISRVFLFISDS